ncbi:MAG: hypothetical protein ACLP0J_13670 [Solirubrobacteraceae bacterium]|jgi:hypothetical protein
MSAKDFNELAKDLADIAGLPVARFRSRTLSRVDDEKVDASVVAVQMLSVFARSDSGKHSTFVLVLRVTSSGSEGPLLGSWLLSPP